MAWKEIAKFIDLLVYYVPHLGRQTMKRGPLKTASTQISVLLGDIEKGDQVAASRLLPIVYKELRKLAAHYMRREKSGQTLQPTELVHEAYLRLVGNERINWQGRSHFLALAATSMRRILVDRARKKLCEKHGAGGQKVEFEEGSVFAPHKSEQLVALDDALESLESISPRQSRVVELRFFGGLEMEEIAKVEGVSVRTVQEEWRLARAWLHQQIARGH